MTPQPRRNGLPVQPLYKWGREPFSGQMNRNAKFRAEEVQWIVRLHHFGLSLNELAELYDVTKDCVSKIVKGHRYKDDTIEVRRKYATN